MSGKLLVIYICIFHVLSHFLLIYICKLHWNLHRCNPYVIWTLIYHDAFEKQREQIEGKLLVIYIWNFHVLSHLLPIYMCKLHWNLNTWGCLNSIPSVFWNSSRRTSPLCLVRFSTPIRRSESSKREMPRTSCCHVCLLRLLLDQDPLSPPVPVGVLDLSVENCFPSRGHNLTRTLPRTCHNLTRILPRTCHNLTRTLLRTCHNLTQTLPRTCHNLTQTLLRTYHKLTQTLPRNCHNLTRTLLRTCHKSLLYIILHGRKK